MEIAEAVATIVRAQEAYAAAVAVRAAAESVEADAWIALENARHAGREVMKAAGVASGYTAELVR
jgi:hypothetical protein